MDLIRQLIGTSLRFIRLSLWYCNLVPLNNPAHYLNPKRAAAIVIVEINVYGRCR